MADARAALRGGEAATTGLWWVGDPSAAQTLARRLGVHSRDVAIGAEHGAGALSALREAMLAIEQRRFDVAIVAGASVLSGDESLARLRRDGRVLGGDSSSGTVPGEAAAAVILAPERVRVALHWSSLGRLVSVATARESIPFGGTKPGLGEGLVEAINAVLESLHPDRRAAHVLCNLNNERQRVDEWGFALPRVQRRLLSPSAFVTPISAFGDVEATGGLLLLGLACKLGQSSGAAGPPCLVWASSSGHERGAALVEGTSHTESKARQIDAPSPRWAKELDALVLAEMADECAFRYQQRSFEYERLGQSPPTNWRSVEHIEGSLDALVRGLVEAGPPGLRALERLSEDWGSGSAYTKARVLLEAGRDAAAQSQIARDLCSARPFAQAIDSAVSHARPDLERASALVGEWLADPNPSRVALALRLAARMRISLGGARLLAVAERVPDTAPELAAALLHGLAQLGTPEARPLIGRWQRSPDARVRREWALAELRLGGSSGRENVLAWAEQDPAVVISAALVADAPRVRRLRELAIALSGNDACLALGILGDPLGIEHLLERLASPATARLAACALELLLGAVPCTTRLEPDADPIAPPRSVPSISFDPAHWLDIASSVLESHPKHLRLRGGRPATVAITLELIRRPHLPQRVRRYLVRELRLRWGLEHALDVHDLLRHQRPSLELLDRMREPTPPGSWDCVA
jgi:hypothetical protein